MSKKTTSLKIDPETWKMAKKKCIDKDLSISEYIEALIKKDIKLIVLIVLVIALKTGLVIPILISKIQKKKIIVDLDVTTLAFWDKKDENKIIEKIKSNKLEMITPYILLEHLSKWDYRKLAEEISNFYEKYSSQIITTQNLLEATESFHINYRKLLLKIINVGVKEEDVVLVVICSFFEIDYLVTFNRKHLKNKEKEINEVLKENGLKPIKIKLPSEL